MYLTLQLVSAPNLEQLPQRSCTFGIEGGKIGRLPNNEWFIPFDYLHGLHATVRFYNGLFFIEKRGQHRVAVNSPERDLKTDETYPIRDGDRLYLDELEVSVRVAAEPPPAPVQPKAAAPKGAAPMPMYPERTNPGRVGSLLEPDPKGDSDIDAFLNFGAASPAPAVTRHEAASHQSILSDAVYLAPETTSPSRLPQQSFQSQPGLDDEWYKTQYKTPAPSSPPGFANPPRAAPQTAAPFDPRYAEARNPPSAPPADSRYPDYRTPTPAPPFESRHAEPRAPAAPPAFDSRYADNRAGAAPPAFDPRYADRAAAASPAFDPRYVDRAPAAPPGLDPRYADRAPAPSPAFDSRYAETRAPIVAPPAQPGRPGEEFAVLLQSLGLNPRDLLPGDAELLGRALRAALGGVVSALQVRTEMRSRFRMATSDGRRLEETPLEASANVDDALHRFFRQRAPGAPALDLAIAGALSEIKSHEYAVLDALRVTFDRLIERFNPESIQEQIDNSTTRASRSMLGGKSRHWDAYLELYAALAADREDFFRKFCAPEFSSAYKKALEKYQTTMRARHRP